MKNILLGIFIATMTTVSALAVENGDSCDDNTLQSTGGSVELNANWQENQINLKWYNGDNVFHSNTCVYGENIDLPTTNPTKTGYQFVKWQVKLPQCDFSGLDTSINGIYRAGKDSSDLCYYYNKATGDESEECSDSVFSDLNVGEWKAGFSYGMIKGTTKCSSTSGTRYQTGTPSDTEGKYCWCSVTNYTPNGGETCSAVSRWVFRNDSGSASVCASGCARYCGNVARNDEAMRVALFELSKPQEQQCSLSGLDTSIGGIAGGGKGSDFCYYYNDDTDDKSYECSDSWFSDLNVGEWKTEFSYGMIKGTSKCSLTSGSFGQTGTPSDTKGINCWCQLTNYTPNGGETCPAVSRWVVNNGNYYGSASACASRCASSCGHSAQLSEAMRVGLFGSVAQ